jgi:hypothetical protein
MPYRVSLLQLLEHHGVRETGPTKDHGLSAEMPDDNGTRQNISRIARILGYEVSDTFYAPSTNKTWYTFTPRVGCCEAIIAALRNLVCTEHSTKESFIARVRWVLEQDWRICLDCGAPALPDTPCVCSGKRSAPCESE